MYSCQRSLRCLCAICASLLSKISVLPLICCLHIPQPFHCHHHYHCYYHHCHNFYHSCFCCHFFCHFSCCYHTMPCTISVLDKFNKQSVIQMLRNMDQTCSNLSGTSTAFHAALASQKASQRPSQVSSMSPSPLQRVFPCLVLLSQAHLACRWTEIRP